MSYAVVRPDTLYAWSGLSLLVDGVPISVSSVKPASIDTPFYEKPKTFIVADVILRCAEMPTREMIAGGAAELMNLRPAATVAALVALMVGAFAIANRVSPFE